LYRRLAINARILPGPDDSSCYRNNAAKCLLAAHDARESHSRKLRLSMAVSWLSLARQDEAMDDLFASAETDVKTAMAPCPGDANVT
jgi:hypothetical protein